jgi:hypothetical protein
MTFRERIVDWCLYFLGIPDLLQAQREALQAQLSLQREQFQQELETALSDERTAYRAELKQEFDSRIGVVLEASITASERIARVIARRGDDHLKEYVDSFLKPFEQEQISK